jgi:Ni/Co efflux regulator RcnB
MFKRLLLLLVLGLGMFAQTASFAAKHKKQTKKHKSTVSASKKKKSKKTVAYKKSSKKKKGNYYAKNSRKHKKSRYRKGPRISAEQLAADRAKRAASKDMIAQNLEKKKQTDSAHKLVFVNVNKEEEGYFASMFTKQKQAASFQTLEGTAAVFKSVSGWEDKKFYILTNDIPVGTLVRITTPDFKSICAKVISALPDVGNSIQYRLNDAAAAILGMTSKTFKISVTY